MARTPPPLDVELRAVKWTAGCSLHAADSKACSSRVSRHSARGAPARGHDLIEREPIERMDQRF
jgi:hypothetical protein